jgi:hypothetical protein
MVYAQCSIETVLLLTSQNVADVLKTHKIYGKIVGAYGKPVISEFGFFPSEHIFTL